MLEPRTPEREVWGRDLPPLCCVLEQDTFTPRKVLVIPRKWWLRPDMTEKLLTGTLSLNKTKPKLKITSNASLGTGCTGSNKVTLPHQKKSRICEAERKRKERKARAKESSSESLQPEFTCS